MKLPQGTASAEELFRCHDNWKMAANPRPQLNYAIVTKIKRDPRYLGQLPDQTHEIRTVSLRRQEDVIICHFVTGRSPIYLIRPKITELLQQQ